VPTPHSRPPYNSRQALRRRGLLGRAHCHKDLFIMPKRTRGQVEKPSAKRQRLLGNLAAAIDRSSGRMVARRSRVMPPETKMFDVTFTSATSSAADWTGSEVPMTSYIDSTGTTVSAYTDSALIPSAIGAGYGQVQGNKYYLKNIRVRGEIQPQTGVDQADVPNPATCRVILVHDTQPNGAQAQGEEVLTDLGSAAQCQYSFLAMGAGSGGRFRILKDKTYRLQPAAASTDGTNTSSVMRSGATFSFSYKPKKPIQVILKANSTTPTVASLSNNNIFLLAHTSLATGGAVSIIGASRCYYQD